MEKEGIQSAIDFVKYILALSGGAIAFAIQPSFYAENLQVKVLASFGVFMLTVSIIAGIFCFRIPGLIMLGFFTFSFAFIVYPDSLKVRENSLRFVAGRIPMEA